MFDRFMDVELTVGKGENNFTMSRGSFRYKQRISEKESYVGPAAVFVRQKLLGI